MSMSLAIVPIEKERDPRKNEKWDGSSPTDTSQWTANCIGTDDDDNDDDDYYDMSSNSDSGEESDDDDSSLDSQDMSLAEELESDHFVSRAIHTFHWPLATKPLPRTTLDLTKQLALDKRNTHANFSKPMETRKPPDRTHSFYKSYPVACGLLLVKTEPPTSVIMDRGDAISPKDTFRSLLARHGHSFLPFSHDTQSWVQGNIEAYTLQLMRAVRQDDLATIKTLCKSGHDLQCSNRFRESILHAVARRGRVDILQFLVEEAGVSMLVCCDQGRTILHDAAWTETPNFVCIRYILSKHPHLLLIADKRNFTPLDYAPRASWRGWDEFLSNHSSLLLPSKASENTAKISPWLLSFFNQRLFANAS